jgi:hypothetical protein
MNSTGLPPCVLKFPMTLLETLAAAVAQHGNPAFDSAQAANDELERRARLFEWRLDRAYEQATSGSRVGDVFESFREIAPDLSQLGQAMVDWLDVVETLVQEAERKYGTAPGHGAMKAVQVKSVLVSLALANEDLVLPRVPRIFRALILEAVISWGIDVVVLLLNQNDELWQAGSESKSSVAVAMSKPLTWLLAFGDWLQRQAFGDWLVRKINQAILKANPLSPALQAEIKKMLANGNPSSRQVLQSFTHLTDWVGAHHKELTALIQLVSLVVKEAEGFLNMSGPEKKQYARALIVVFLEDSGILDGSPVADAVARWLVDWGIEFVVTVLRKRGISTPAAMTISNGG